MVTTIQISDKLWDYLKAQKKARGETFEDVIWKMIKKEKKQ